MGKSALKNIFAIVSFFIGALCLLSTAYSAPNTEDYLIDVTDEVIAEITPEQMDAAQNAFVPAEKEMGKFMELLDDMSLSFSVSASLDLLRGFGVKAKYKYKVKPSYIGDSYSRIDRYVLQLPFQTAKILIDKNTPWVLDITPEMEMRFVQFLDTGKRARRLKNAYTPARFPLTAERAINRLKPGDLTFLRARLNLLVGYRHEWDIGPSFEFRNSDTFLVSGIFDLFVFRADDNKIRMRVVGRQLRESEIKFEIGVEDDFEIYGVKLLDNGLVRLTKLDDIFTHSIAKNRHNIFLADYTLDLNNPEAAKAYDNILSKAYTFKNAVRTNQITSAFKRDMKREELQRMFISNLSRLDEIYLEDLGKAPANRRVNRNFSGSNNTKGLRRPTNFGIRGIFRLKHEDLRQSNYLERLVLNEDGSTDQERYYFPTWTRRFSKKAALSRHEEESYRSTKLIYFADDNFKPMQFKNIGFYFEYTDKKYKKHEHGKLIAELNSNLPEPVQDEVLKQLRERGFLDLTRDFKNVRVSARYFINENGLRAVNKALEGLTGEQTVDYVRHHIIKMLKITRVRIKGTKQMRQSDAVYWCPRNKKALYEKLAWGARRFCWDIEAIAENIAKIIDPGTTPEAREVAVDSVSENRLFRAAGAGILYSLIPEEQKAASSYIDLKFYTPITPEPISVKYGHVDDRELMETLIEIEEIMQDLQPDMRLYGTEDNMTIKRVNGR